MQAPNTYIPPVTIPPSNPKQDVFKWLKPDGTLPWTFSGTLTGTKEIEEKSKKFVVPQLRGFPSGYPSGSLTSRPREEPVRRNPSPIGRSDIDLSATTARENESSVGTYPPHRVNSVFTRPPTPPEIRQRIEPAAYAATPLPRSFYEWGHSPYSYGPRW